MVFPSCGRTQRKPSVLVLSAAVEGRQQRDAHEHRVAVAVDDVDGAGAAEFQQVGIALRAAVARDEERVEVVDPFPDEAVQVAHAVQRSASPPTGGQRAAAGLLVPGEDAARAMPGRAAHRRASRPLRRRTPTPARSAAARLRSRRTPRRRTSSPRSPARPARRRARAPAALPLQQVARIGQDAAARWPRCHSGCARTKAANSPTVTGVARIANGWTSTGVDTVGTGPCGSTLSKRPPGSATYGGRLRRRPQAAAGDARDGRARRTVRSCLNVRRRLGGRPGRALLLHVFLRHAPPGLPQLFTT